MSKFNFHVLLRLMATVAVVAVPLVAQWQDKLTGDQAFAVGLLLALLRTLVSYKDLKSQPVV